MGSSNGLALSCSRSIDVVCGEFVSSLDLEKIMGYARSDCIWFNWQRITVPRSQAAQQLISCSGGPSLACHNERNGNKHFRMRLQMLCFRTLSRDWND